jgi:hypothetical protein
MLFVSEPARTATIDPAQIAMASYSAARYASYLLKLVHRVKSGT